MDDVRAAAKVSKSQLYHYFADKDDLIHAVIGATIRRVIDEQFRTGKVEAMSLLSAASRISSAASRGGPTGPFSDSAAERGGPTGGPMGQKLPPAKRRKAAI